MANELAIMQKDITDQVNGKIKVLENDGLQLPQNYNPSNALKSAFFAMTNSGSGNLLEKCTPDSIANSLLDMVTQGLSPAKTQCYFIPYGNQLKLNRSYFGTQAVLKRLNNVKDVWANVIYDGDEFTIGIVKGREVLLEHNTKFENRDNEIKGVYAIIERSDGEQVLTVMTRKEVEAAWSQGKTKNVQNKFPQEMAKRTVINRAAKPFINTSDDSDLLVQAINNTTESEYDNERKVAEPVEEVQQEIDENANSQIIDFDQPEEKNKKPVKEVEKETVNKNEPTQEALFDDRKPPFANDPEF